MLNENKVKVMTKMAMYENGQGAEDKKIGSYYKRDYVSLKTLISIIWMTVGYFLIVALVGCLFLDEILKRLTIDYLIMLAIAIVVLYLAILLLYIVGANQFYKRKYSDARMRIKKYNHYLTRLNRMYEKEKR